MKIISNYLGREQRESWREEKMVNAKKEMRNESKGKERERECAPPCEQWQGCQSVTISAEGEGEPKENFVDKGKG